MALSFLNSIVSCINREDDHYHGLDKFLISQETFNELLALERKRTARSKRPFILMSINITGCSNTKNERYVLGKELIGYLNAVIRDTDTIGWYLRDRVIGIIFTEIRDNSTTFAEDIIAGKVKNGLLKHLGPERANSLRISLFYYPEKDGNSSGKSSLEPTLYPDIVHKNSRKKVSLFLKRAIDIIGAVIALILSLPIMMSLWILIRLTSEGPALFKQERIGRFGEKFTLLKFRSMYVNNDSAVHKQYIHKLIKCPDDLSGSNGTEQVFKITDDSRVTSIGRILRMTSLDELPQFLNVLKGNMSLVGPRPPIPYELENYDIWHRRRILEMKPGITGLWQVYGRSRTTFDEMVRLDIRYMDEWSLWLDIKLLLQTPWAVVMGNGAY